MARVLFTSTLGTSSWAGSEVLWFQAASLLVSRGHEVAAVLPSQMHVPDIKDRLSAARIALLSRPTDRLRYLGARLGRRWKPDRPSGSAPIVSWARRWKADIVVFSQASCWGSYSEMLALAEAGIPYVCISQLNTPFSWLGDRLFEAVGKAFQNANAAVFVSQSNLELFQNQVACKLDNAHVIYNPPSFDVSRPCNPPPNDVFRLLNVARITPGHKGQDLITDVLDNPKWRERDVFVEIAGGGDRRWMEELIVSKGLTNISLLGHISDLQGAWERATFGILPSRQEGMPLALIEGMALGRSFIATDVAGHAEWIEEGKTGFLARGTTASSLDSAMEAAWLSKGRAGDMGRRARETFSDLLPIAPAATLAGVICE